MDVQAGCSPDGKHVPDFGGRLGKVFADGGLDGRRNLRRRAHAMSIIETVDAVVPIALDPPPDHVFRGVEHERNLRDAVGRVLDRSTICAFCDARPAAMRLIVSKKRTPSSSSCRTNHI